MPQKSTSTKPVFTGEEIEKMFMACEHLDYDFKSKMYGTVNALHQAMYNSVTDPAKYMKMCDANGDLWQEAYCWFVANYQRVHD
jgi:hypothetical protein